MPVIIDGADDWDGCMAASVDPAGDFAAFRVFKHAKHEGDVRVSAIAFATSVNGSEIAIDDTLMFYAPDPLGFEKHAVEDPTLFRIGGNLWMAYTNVTKPISALGDTVSSRYPPNARGDHYAEIRLCDFSGEYISALSPTEISNFKFEPINGVKEFEIVPDPLEDGRYVVFFEAGGPWWHDSRVMTGRMGADMMIRDIAPVPALMYHPQLWYKTHTSTGPIVKLGDNDYVMFFNGRWQNSGTNGEWAVGAARFHIASNRPVFDWVSRRPLVRDRTKTRGYEGQIICFASSVAEVERVGNTVSGLLYAHIGDLAICVYEFVINL